MSQRGAANLFVSEVLTSLTIPPVDTPLHQALAHPQILSGLLDLEEDGRLTDGALVRRIVERQAGRGFLPPPLPARVQVYADDILLIVARDVIRARPANTHDEARQQEFRALQRAATHGHPAQPSSVPGTPPHFEVIAGQVREVLLPSGHRFRITPVSRLRVVMVNTGYRRLDDGSADLVPATLQDGQTEWLPGVELHGEGVFIDLTPDPGQESAVAHFPLGGSAATAWQSAWGQAPELKLHPVFAWWHTFSHRVMLALSVDSGYSSAAVRERVYARVDAAGNAAGGVLIYTAQSGGDGTLGGLIALVPRFERVLRAALRDIDSCSNDPLCGEESYGPDRANGAACYACEFVSETACEFRNTSLDRTLLVQDTP